MKIDFLKIKPTFLPPKGNKQMLDSYVSSMERLIKEMIPTNLFQSEVTPPYFLSYQSYFQKLAQKLPLVKWSSTDEAPSTLSIAVLCAANFTQGTGRFFCDIMARYLIPGKYLLIPLIRSLRFCFIIYPKQELFITEIYINIENKRDLCCIQQNLPRLAKELRITLLATQHIRKLVLSKPLTIDEKRMLLFQNLSSLVDCSEEILDPTILEDTYNLLLKFTKQEKPSQIPDHLFEFEEHPIAFDHDMLQKIQRFILMFGKSMIEQRETKHLYRVASYLYLFHKIIVFQRLKTNKSYPLVWVKIMQTKLNKKTPILSILICLNFAREINVIDDALLIEKLQLLLPQSQLIENSFIKNQNDKERISTLYLEFERKTQTFFSKQTIKELQKKLPKEIRQLISLSPPHSSYDHLEDEMMRTILTLSKKLKSPKDRSPVIIHFADETKEFLTFTAVIVCLNQSKQKKRSFKDKPQLKILSYQIKTVGIVDHRYTKNAHIIKIRIDKYTSDQHEQDNSFSLYYARTTILNYLKSYFGSILDFNSNMIVKQYEKLSELKTKSPSLPLIEQYFYSLTPGHMQSLLSIETLKSLLDMILKNLNTKTHKDHYYLNSQITSQELLLLIFSQSDELIEKVKREILRNIPSSIPLTSSDLLIKEKRFLSLVVSTPRVLFKKDLLQKIHALPLIQKKSYLLTHLMQQEKVKK